MTRNVIWILGVLSLLLNATGNAQTKLLRFPDIHEDQVVFCHAGDLWRASTSGGAAARLTAHGGQELFPKFSPDGKWIAFTGQYDGDEQVYVISSMGGEPKQLTFYPARGPLMPRHGYDNQVYGWTQDGSAVLFRSLRDADGAGVETALYTVPLDGGLPTKLPMPTSGAGDFSPDGRKVVYSPLFRDFRTWKRYEGGWAQDLYVFDLQSNNAHPIAASKRTERDPMWIGDNIYFVSDRDGTLNLFAFDLATNETTQLTHSKQWDTRWASSDNKRWIIYERNGELVIFDTHSRDEKPISIMVPNDGLAKRPSRYSAEKDIEEFDLSPKGERALFVARGDVFTAPIETGLTRNLTRSSRAHDRAATWSPDGSQVAFVSDLTGEDQVYVINQDGSGTPRPLTDKFESMLFGLRWSPDGKRLAFSDKYGKLYVLTVADKLLQEVADERRGLLRDFSWSPCGQHLAIVLSEPNQFGSIHIWSVADRQLRRVTGEMTDDSGPSWDPKGDYLFFLSRRQFAPQISSIEWNFAGNRDVGIFGLALRKDVKNLFPPQNDEVTVTTPSEQQKPAQAAGEEKPQEAEKKTAGEPPLAAQGTTDSGQKPTAASSEKPATKIDFEGLASRVVRVPIEADNLSGLVAVNGHLLYSVRGAPFYGRTNADKATLQIFDLTKREASTLADDVSAFAVSSDGSKVLIRSKSTFSLKDVKPKATDKKAVATKDLMVDRVPAEEWAEIFEEVWRRYRDFFYVRNMHGYDWKAIGAQYRALLPHVGHRSDLNYVLSEMVSELNAGHCYIQGGDFEVPLRPQVGLPGARFELDAEAGRYRIAKIFPGSNEEEKYRSPLTEVGVDVSVGDYVLAIDGDELHATENPYRLLQHKTQLVTFTVNKRPTFDGARQVAYRPILSEEPLLYLDWVRTNREKVAAASNGRVGYLHIPDMGADGIYEFIKWYYPQIRKEGLVIDVRSNGGGNVSQWIIERLDSTLLGTRFGSLSDDPGTYPATVFHGHMACLINEVSASDGDIFPYRFRQSGLGPLIGKRTWGGVVGITSLGPLLDGGQVFVPLQATNSPTGEYIIEGHGVEPDIEVTNTPKEVIAGGDPQLDRAILEVLKRIESDPKRLPSRPPDPVKTP